MSETTWEMLGSQAVRSELWNLGVRFTVRGRSYELARHGGTSAATWQSWFCWPLRREGDAWVTKPSEREIRINDDATVVIFRPGKPGWLTWKEWADRGYPSAAA